MVSWAHQRTIDLLFEDVLCHLEVTVLGTKVHTSGQHLRDIALTELENVQTSRHREDPSLEATVNSVQNQTSQPSFHLTFNTVSAFRIPIHSSKQPNQDILHGKTYRESDAKWKAKKKDQFEAALAYLPSKWQSFSQGVIILHKTFFNSLEKGMQRASVDRPGEIPQSSS